jgi:nanoRNase/pAp phosphatase (c-di-AMP/oligoRNAs hydrolase)
MSSFSQRGSAAKLIANRSKPVYIYKMAPSITKRPSSHSRELRRKRHIVHTPRSARRVRSWDPLGRSSQFLEAMPLSGNVLLTSHDNPDPDALASCLALQTLMRQKLDINPHIAIGGILGRAENRALTLELEINLYPIDLLEHQHWDGIIMVDAQPGAGNTNLPSNMSITAVIDHHPHRLELAAPFVDIRPEYGASGTIMVEYLMAQGVKWDTRLATALFYAIRSETQDLGSSICEADRRAHFALFDAVDWDLLHRITHAKIPGDYFGLFQRGISMARLYGNVLVTDLGEIPAPDAVAEMADFLLRHETVIRTLVLGRYEDQIVFSLRFARSDLDAGIVASSMARNLGTGGGHDQAAGGRILLTRPRLTKTVTIKETIVDRFLELVGMLQHKPGDSLLPSVSLTGSPRT